MGVQEKKGGGVPLEPVADTCGASFFILYYFGVPPSGCETEKNFHTLLWGCVAKAPRDIFCTPPIERRENAHITRWMGKLRVRLYITKNCHLRNNYLRKLNVLENKFKNTCKYVKKYATMYFKFQGRVNKWCWTLPSLLFDTFTKDFCFLYHSQYI